MEIRLKCLSTVVIQNHMLLFLPTAGDLIFGINILVILLIGLALCPKGFHPSEMTHLGKQIGLRYTFPSNECTWIVEGMLRKRVK